MDEISTNFGYIEDIYIERIKLREPFPEFAARFAGTTGTAVLLSGGELDCARYHILATKPWLTLSGQKKKFEIKKDEKVVHWGLDPFSLLQMLLDTFSSKKNVTNLPNLSLPVTAGLFGYFSYDLKDYLEKLPRTTVDRLCLPELFLFAPSILVIHDKWENHTHLCIPVRKIGKRKTLEKTLDFFKEKISPCPVKNRTFEGDPAGFKSDFSRNEYIRAIKNIKRYIAAGHVYQVNMAQEFITTFKGDAFGFFQSLYAVNPAPFFAYLNLGDHQVVSTSPERFILQRGKKVETRPIKGTRPRGKTVSEDNKLKTDLENSKKDDAELSMIVDLLRNDIGKVCKAGSVQVSQHKKLETYQNVHHLVSVIVGELDEGVSSVDLIKASFPGGSITGCPKIRAMEIIDELERNRRHVYTGSMGYLSFHETMDLSIAIRTAVVINEQIKFSVGGGIVFDSVPSDEYDETLHKGRTLMEAFKGKEIKPAEPEKLWMNGAVKTLEKARVPVADPGFQYGYGFFETIRVKNGILGYLDAHLERFNKTWRHLCKTPPPDLSWDEIIRRIIFENDLTNTTAAVKIIASMGNKEKPPYYHNLIVMARPYTHRLARRKDQGLHLVVYPEPRQSPLADYKTNNYLFYFLAGKWAASQGKDEALILNPDDSLSETNTGNILLIKDNKIILPLSEHVLPGVMMKAVISKLKFTIRQRKLFVDDLFEADQLMVTNSLMGAVPVISINGKALKKPSGLCKEINEQVL